MEFKKQNPIYLQIADMLCMQILQGTWAAEERVPSVREVATQFGVNPNTVMRTFEYLQQNEIIYNRRGVGYFVSAKAVKVIRSLQRKQFLGEEVPEFLRRMRGLGVTFDELKQIDERIEKGRDIQ